MPCENCGAYAPTTSTALLEAGFHRTLRICTDCEQRPGIGGMRNAARLIEQAIVNGNGSDASLALVRTLERASSRAAKAA